MKPNLFTDNVLLVMRNVLFIEPQTQFLGKSADSFPKKCSLN